MHATRVEGGGGGNVEEGGGRANVRSEQLRPCTSESKLAQSRDVALDSLDREGGGEREAVGSGEVLVEKGGWEEEAWRVEGGDMLSG